VHVVDGHVADQFIVVARSAGQAGDEDGITLFLLDRARTGVTVDRRIMADSRNMAEVRLDNVEVAGTDILGELHSGYDLLCKILDRGTIGLCAEMLGSLQAAFDRTLDYLKQREQFGVPIGTFQALQHIAADMYAEIELCKSANILASIQIDESDEEQRKADISAAKLQLSDGGWFVQENAIQLFGGIGVTDEQDEGLFFKRLRVLQALFGDADWHVDRYQRLRRFDAEVRAER